MIVLKMAWRNVWRNYRRSGITIAAMALALVVELIYSGLVSGMMIGMENDVTEFELGDVQIFREGYLTRPSLYDAIEDPDPLVGMLEEKGYRATARLFAGGLASSEEFSSGVQFVGIDPEKDARVLSLDEAMGEGTWLSDDDPTGVVVGRGLARTLGLKIGSELVVLSQASDGSVANDLYTVRGILLSVAASMDRSAVLMTEKAFRELMVFPRGAHKIIVRRPQDVPLEEAKSVVERVAASSVPEPGTDGAYALDVMTWKEISPFIATWMDSVSGVIVVVYLIVYLAVGILILNAMLMAVFERIREFGVLKAIGYGPFQVLSMMVAEGILQASVALVIGLLLAAPAMWYLQAHGINVGALGGIQVVGMTMPAIWYGHYAFDTAVVPVVVLFFVVFGAVIYPAMKAAWVKPVEAMHHQ